MNSECRSAAGKLCALRKQECSAYTQRKKHASHCTSCFNFRHASQSQNYPSSKGHAEAPTLPQLHFDRVALPLPPPSFKSSLLGNLLFLFCYQNYSSYSPTSLHHSLVVRHLHAYAVPEEAIKKYSEKCCNMQHLSTPASHLTRFPFTSTSSLIL